jgi:lycopene cyclase domain-containing protein
LSTYLWINLLAVIIPLVLSFDKKVHFYKHWKHLFPAMIITAAAFIGWDAYFTTSGIWGFNPLHLSGYSLFHLPVEEILFFITIPYASLFTYEVLNAYIEKDLLGRFASQVTVLLLILWFVLILLAWDRQYTFTATAFAMAVLLINQYVLRSRFMGRFYLAYLVVMFPFLLVNGILTGSFIHEEVVWYNPEEILQWRIFTIPVEDTIYGFGLILMNITLFELFRKWY